MEESVVSFAAQHIENMIDEEPDTIISNVRSEAEALHKEFKILDKLLVKAECNKRGHANNEQVRAWFKEVRRIAYEAEDVVDNFVSETERIAFSSLIRLRSTRGAAIKKLRGLKERVQKITAKLYEYDGEGSLKTQIRPEQVLALQQGDKDDFVVGINADVERLVKMLVGKSQSQDAQNKNQGHMNSIDVLAIVGMGGSGKSTIARSIYNHKSVREHFKYKAWASLSQGWDASRELYPLLTEITKQITGSNGSGKDLLQLSNRIIDQKEGNDNDNQSIEVQTKSKLQNLRYYRECKASSSAHTRISSNSWTALGILLCKIILC